jgi:choline dehydrogenase-like flavoprotein
MRANNPDVVVVGAGIAGASIAAVLARGGVEVLLLERQRGYRDRVRGEYMAPWGVLEARALGLEDVIRSTQAVNARYSVPYDELSAPSIAEEAKSDRSTIFPDVRGPLCASHPKTCRALGGRSRIRVLPHHGGVTATPTTCNADRRPTILQLDQKRGL